MTEQEWQRCEQPSLMLEEGCPKVAARKHRLFACACCRRLWDLLSDPRSRRAVEVSEAYADRMCTKEDLVAAHREADAAETANN